MDRVQRTLYRSLVRLARTFDANPALKALVCRNHGPPLPEPLDTLVARFLGGPLQQYFWPPASGTQQAPRVQDAVHAAFRHPPAGAAPESAFDGLRYLSGLLAIARKHHMLPDSAVAPVAGGSAADLALREAAAAAAGQGEEERQLRRQRKQAEAGAADGLGTIGGSHAGSEASLGDEEAQRQRGLQLAPALGRGVLLIAHPCLAGNMFNRSVVLLCQHGDSGADGLILNKPLGSSLSHLHERLRQLGAGPGGPGAVPGGAFGGGLGSGGGGGSGSFLFGSGPPSTWHSGHSGGGGGEPGSGISSGDLAAATAGASDIPAEQLQQVVDFLAWKQDPLGLAEAAAAAAAAEAPPEHDEYGNWLEPSSYNEEAGSEGEGEEDGEWSAIEVPEGAGRLPAFLSALAAQSASDSDSSGEEGPNPAMVFNSLMKGLGAALRESGADVQGDEWAMSPEDAQPGVSEELRDLLQRVGGGSIVMVDPQGNLWSHHMPDSSSDDEFAQDGADTLQDDDPSAVADLVMRCLTPNDRKLLAHQEKLALERRLLAQGGMSHTPAAAAAAEAANAPAGSEVGSAGSGSSAVSASSSSGGGGTGGGVSSVMVSASKAQQMMQRVEQLLEEAEAAPTAAWPQQQQQQQQRQQPSIGGLQAAGSASSLFGTGRPSGQLGAAAEAGSGSSGGSPSVTELMGVFKDSPLFRGGPVPGVQVLHQSPRLGGHLVLPPWGVDPSHAPDEAASAAAARAVDNASEARDARLHGGLVVGADLDKAQELIAEGVVGAEDVRICMGTSLWSPGQLEAEVARGTWAVVSACPPFLDLFAPLKGSSSSEDEQLLPGFASSGTASSGGTASSVTDDVLDYETHMWAKCLGALGPQWASLAQVPKAAWEDLAELEV